MLWPSRFWRCLIPRTGSQRMGPSNVEVALRCHLSRLRALRVDGGRERRSAAVAIGVRDWDILWLRNAELVDGLSHYL